MRLLLMRHGIAADLNETIQTDAERPLTAEGTRKTRQVARGLKEIGESLDLIAASPLLRAQQTAAIVQEVCGVEALATWPELERAEPAKLLRRLKTLKVETVLLVGHEPGIGHFASHLLTGNKESAAIEFKKAAICALEVDLVSTDARATLLWHAPPRLLRE